MQTSIDQEVLSTGQEEIQGKMSRTERVVYPGGLLQFWRVNQAWVSCIHQLRHPQPPPHTDTHIHTLSGLPGTVRHVTVLQTPW